DRAPLVSPAAPDETWDSCPKTRVFQRQPEFSLAVCGTCILIEFRLIGGNEGDADWREQCNSQCKACEPGPELAKDLRPPGATAGFSLVRERCCSPFLPSLGHSSPAHSKGSKPFMFDAPVALLDGLKASGIKIVSFANNHVMDQGWPGFAETREHLRDEGLLFAGSGDTAQQQWQPVITEANGIKVGWLGMTRWLNGNRNPDKDDQPHVNFFPYPGESGGAPGMDEAGVLDAIGKARAQCDFLVVSIHWGTEYAPAPRPEDVDTAHKMLEAGASVIVGHHPHVLQPVETYRTADGRDTVIFYSLGNFLSNQSRNYVDGLMPDKDGDPRDEMIGLFSAVRKDYGPAGVRVELGHVGVLPAWSENNRNEIAAGRAKTAMIRPILMDREIPRLQAKLDELSKLNTAATPLTAAQKKEFIELTNQLKLLDDRRKLLVARVGDEYIMEAPESKP
ncbi:MAG: CapA family protein, partial [Terracidiphilus sp.]